LPPVVVSGLPNITPIFMRIWLMKITMQFERPMLAVSLRMAWLIRRAWAAHLHVAHVALDFGLGHQGGDRVDHDQADRAGAHQRIDDLQRLFAGVGLADQQFIQVDAQLLGILRVKRVFGIDKGADAALFLFFGHDMQRQRGLARRFRPVDLDDPALGQAADAKRDVEAQRAGRGRLDLHRRAVGAKPHDRALAELPLDLRERAFQRLRLVHVPLAPKVEEVCHRHVVLLIS
jgi:hypothetical protein